MSPPLARIPVAPAVAVARAAGALSRGLRRGGGTSLPGTVLLRLRPDAVGLLGRRLDGGSVLVSATNGKTTTARLIASCASKAGVRLVANRSGANLMTGVATALLQARPHRHDPRSGLFEVDEAALEEVARQLRPRVVLLMNLFRDQLDRYGELETLAARWEGLVRALPPDATVVLNADDPAVAALADAHPGTMLFGVDDPAVALDALPHAADSIRCRRCGGPLNYSRVVLAHLGDWSCPSCGSRRPVPEVRATGVTLHGAAGLSVAVTTPAGELEVEVPLPGVHNAYNITAAVAAGIAMGLPLEAIGRGLQAGEAAFGRAERLRLEGRDLVLLLAKNPTGANETVRTVLLDPEPPHLLIALNDRTADGRDISWVWDVDYEPLLERAASLTLTGDRAHELALRFRYAGVDGDRLNVEPDPATALECAVALVPSGGTLYVLPTYTAMLGLRELLVGRGVAEAFWREP